MIYLLKPEIIILTNFVGFIVKTLKIKKATTRTLTILLN